MLRGSRLQSSYKTYVDLNPDLMAVGWDTIGMDMGKNEVNKKQESQYWHGCYQSHQKLS
jgi:hypothetical protein